MWQDFNPNPPNPPVNYLESVKGEIHDELFEYETDKSIEIVERLFKYLEYEVVSSEVKGEKAIVTLSITNINGGAAWQDALEKYAIYCFDNAFSEQYVGVNALEDEYLKSLESAFKAADYITTIVDVKMEFCGSRWVVDVDRALVDAITGNLLSAKQGRLIPEVETEEEIIPQNNYIEVPMKSAIPLSENYTYNIYIDKILYNVDSGTYEWMLMYENNTDKDIYAFTENMAINSDDNEEANWSVVCPANGKTAVVFNTYVGNIYSVQFNITSCDLNDWSTLQKEEIGMEFEKNGGSAE